VGLCRKDGIEWSAGRRGSFWQGKAGNLVNAQILKLLQLFLL
jgi:hypothetical protein